MKKTYKLKGMNCNSCAMLIEKSLKDKVNHVSASYSKEEAIVDFDENKISEKEIIEEIEKLGYECYNGEISDSGQDLEDLIKQKGELKEMFLSEEISSEQYEKLKKEVEDKISKLEKVEKKKQIEKSNRESYKEEKSLDLQEIKTEKALVKAYKQSDTSDKFGWIMLIVSLALLAFILYYFVLRHLTMPEMSVQDLGSNASIFLLFAAGLLAGFHCVSMCGAFVLSYTTKNAQNGHKGYKQHLVYGGSKVISYAVIGGIFGLIGGFIAFSTGLRGVVAILAGVFMIFYALSMFGLKFFRKFQFNPKFLTNMTSKAQSKAKGPYKGPFITGLLNGLFIACGPLQAMYLYAAGTGSVVSGATALAAFGLGTLPVMIGFGSLATVISHNTTKKILKFSAIIVLALGLIMLNRGLTVLGSPYSFDSIKSKIINPSVNSVSSNSNVPVINNGVQEINMDVSGAGYSPNSFVLKKGVPVKWNINVKQLTGCNSELIANNYNIDLNLKQGLNTAEFTPDKVGTFQFSCGMGMLHGSFIVTDSGTASQAEVAAATPAKGMQCGGSGGGGCGCGG